MISNIRIFSVLFFTSCCLSMYKVYLNSIPSKNLSYGVKRRQWSSSSMWGWLAGCLSTRSRMSFVQEHQHDLVGGKQVLPGSSVSLDWGLVASSGGIPQDGNGDLRGMDLSHNLKILFWQCFQDTLGKHKWWSGATDVGREGSWYWTHSLTPVGDFVWGTSQPDGGTVQNYMCFSYAYDYYGIDTNTVTHDQNINPLCQRNWNKSVVI